MSAWMSSRTWELKPLKAPEHFFFLHKPFRVFFIVPLDIFTICRKWWSLCFDTLMMSGWFFLNERFFSLTVVELEEEPTLCTSSSSHTQCCCEPGEHLFPEHHRAKILKQAGSIMWLRCFCHCFPPRFSNVCTPFPRTCAPKEGASDPGSWKLTACSKDLWWSVLGMSWNCACVPWASVRQSVEEETFRLGQSDLTSSLKKRHVAALPRAKSNHEVFCSTPSKLWSSGAYWQVCRILWVSDKQVHICFAFGLSNGVLIVQKLEKATDQIREIWKPVECIFEYCSNCLVPERPNICAQWNLCGELGVSGSHGAVKSHLCMAITEKVCLHVFAEQEHCFEWCQVKLWIEWELYTVPLRNQLIWSGSIACSRKR